MTVYALRNPVKHYAWGSHTALPELLGQPSPSVDPWAEIWIGAHARGSSEIRVDGEWRSLRSWIAADPSGTLGDSIAKRHGELPFLVKLLAAAAPLSIQTHPDAAGARSGYEREEAAGIALDAPNRCFADPNPKPELVVALDRFEVLCGVRPLAEIESALARLGSDALVAHFAATLADADPGGLVRTWLGTEPATAARLIDEAVRGSAAGGADDPGLAWIAPLADAHPGDVGALAPLFLRYRALEPGEGVFVGAGVAHGYLRGTAVEVQASSDNVLRGALTHKHVDLESFLAALRPTETPTVHPAPERSNATWPAETDRFALRLEHPGPDGPRHCRCERGAEILLCTEGRAEIRAEGASVALQPGAAAFVAGRTEHFSLRGSGTVFRASAA